jgi:uncharacterized protein YvpB
MNSKVMRFSFPVLTVAVLLISNICSASIGSNFHIDKNIAIKGNVYISPVIEFNHPMDRAVLSWNVATLGDSYIELFLRARAEGHGWSNWFDMGVWGKNAENRSFTGQKNGFGKVDIDTLELNDAATEWQYKIIVHKSTAGGAPTIYAVALAAKDSKNYKKESSGAVFETKQLTVPRLSQFETGNKANRPDIEKRICSPTSVTMLLIYNGVDNITPLDVAAKVYDKGEDAYGNWSFNTATIFSYLSHSTSPSSFASYVRWYDSFDELLKNVDKGEPVVVSISFKEGELKGAPMPTPGHLVLIRGADAKYVYVNDPAAPTWRTVARKYPRDEFIKAWKGVAYVVEKETE